MSAQTDEDAHSLQDGTGVPFDPADYVRQDDESTPDPELM